MVTTYSQDKGVLRALHLKARLSGDARFRARERRAWDELFPRFQATLDLRLLPDRNPQQAIDTLHRLIGDTRVTIEAIQTPAVANVSAVEAEFYRTLTGVIKTLVPASVTAPMLTPGTTDFCFFRGRGVNSYGLFPAILTPGELARFHGIDERISVANLQLGTQIIYTVLRAMTQPR